jgi:hypothetical protein
MGETKPKEATSLRQPKPKKLGLAVPPALRMPHDDLISPERVGETLPSQTSLPSPSSQTRQTKKIAPDKDFAKVPNSLAREVIPAREFKGKSKQLYDSLYAMTRSAITPKMSVRATRTRLMKLAGIGSRVTFESHVAHLSAVGLLTVTPIVGEHEGNEYTVYLPEERSMPSQTSLTSLTSPTQNLDRLVSLESGLTSQSLSVVDTATSDAPKTSFKTRDQNTDDEAFAGLVALLKQASREVTGNDPTASEAARWKDVAELLATELKIAASRTHVSSAPAFLAEHLRRRLRKTDARQIEREVSEATVGAASAASSTKPELTHEEIEEQARLMTSLLRDGAVINELEEQFATDFRPYQWHQIRSITLAQQGYASSRRPDEPTEVSGHE